MYSGNQKLVARNSNIDPNVEFINNRYVCDIKGIIQLMQDKQLSLEEYPSVLPMPQDALIDTSGTGGSSSGFGSLRATGSRFNTAKNSVSEKTTSVPKFHGSRQIIFVAGGACYSELRSVQELMDKGGPETLIGSTTFLKPSDFFHDMI